VQFNLGETLPLAPGDNGLNQVMLGLFTSRGAYDATPLVVLYDREGTPQASVPAGASFDARVLGSAFNDALAGRVAYSAAFRYQGAWANAEVAPVGNGADHRGAVALVRPAQLSSTQAFLAHLGALDGQAGGLTVVEPAGVAFQSWDPVASTVPATLVWSVRCSTGC
jgi:hypothetical protein